MNNNFTDDRYPRCEAINHRAKLAEQHQQAYYRVEILHPAKKSSIWGWIRKYTAVFRPQSSTRHPSASAPDFHPKKVSG